MMAMDFSLETSLRVTMDDDTAELKRQLYTRAAMALEDAASVALRLGAPSSAFDPDDACELVRYVETASQLIASANSLHE